MGWPLAVFGSVCAICITIFISLGVASYIISRNVKD